MRSKIKQSAFLALTVSLASCGSKGGGSSTPAPTDSNQTTSDPDPSANTLAKQPAAADVVGNSQTQAQLTQSGIDTATSAAAAGSNGGTSSAALGLELADSSSPLLGMPSAKSTTGSLAVTCYLGSTLQSRSGGLTWPEATDGIFASSKNDSGSASNMYVEPLLLQYPATSPTSTLNIPAPFSFANLVEVIQTDNRDLNITLNDKAQTSVSQKATNEEHRFWVATNPITGQSSAAMACGIGRKYAQIKWSDDKQIDGLSLLARFKNAGGATRSYLPRKKGVYAAEPVSINSNFGSTGYRLVTWGVSAASAADVTNATKVRKHTITHNFTRLDQVLDDKATVTSDLSHVDQARANDPLVIQTYFDSSEKVLAHSIVSGTIYKTATDSSGNPKWFSTMSYANVQFDLVHSTEPCIPNSGTVTLTVFDKEGGTQKKQVVITYSSVANSATSGMIDPQISVAGDDADGTQAKWMMLMTNRRCDFK